MSSLAPCPACKRHVRIGVTSCPFCAAPLPALRSRNLMPRALTRAAIFSAALAGCQDKKPAPAPAPGAEIGSSAHVVDDAPPIADAAETPTGSGGSAMGSATGSAADDAGVADAGVADAGTGSKAAIDKARALKVKQEKDREQREMLQRHMAKPYGAPPARRRIV